jgi:hypothetical protein
MNSNTTQLTVISNDTYEAKKIANQNYHAISSALQTTLDFHKLAGIFSEKVEGMLHHSAYVYTNVEFKLEIKQGVFSKHSCTYALKFENQPLGALKFLRNSEFEARELELLESLLCCLIYPLRNTILYQRAIKMAYGDPFAQLELTNAQEMDVFSSVFSKGVNAQIEYNRRRDDKKQLEEKKKQVAQDQGYEERSPWAAGLYR